MIKQIDVPEHVLEMFLSGACYEHDREVYSKVTNYVTYYSYLIKKCMKTITLHVADINL